MECPTCSHQFSRGESLKIANPFDFHCPTCVTRLKLGPRGKTVMFASAVGGVAAGKAAAMLWLSTGVSANDFFFTLITTCLALALVWHPVAHFLSDLEEAT